jgi:hypothetical protein
MHFLCIHLTRISRSLLPSGASRWNLIPFSSTAVRSQDFALAQGDAFSSSLLRGGIQNSLLTDLRPLVRSSPRSRPRCSQPLSDWRGLVYFGFRLRKTRGFFSVNPRSWN